MYSTDWKKRDRAMGSENACYVDKLGLGEIPLKTLLSQDGDQPNSSFKDGDLKESAAQPWNQVSHGSLREYNQEAEGQSFEPIPWDDFFKSSGEDVLKDRHESTSNCFETETEVSKGTSNVENPKCKEIAEIEDGSERAARNKSSQEPGIQSPQTQSPKVTTPKRQRKNSDRNLTKIEPLPHSFVDVKKGFAQPRRTRPILPRGDYMQHGSSSSHVDEQGGDHGSQRKRKQRRMRWTKELKASFEKAVMDLGGMEKSTPKKILRAMAETGLSLWQVKSFLQKYRLTKYINMAASSASESEEEEESSLAAVAVEGRRRSGGGFRPASKLRKSRSKGDTSAERKEREEEEWEEEEDERKSLATAALQVTMNMQMEVMREVQALLEEQCNMQAAIETQHNHLMRMLAASGQRMDGGSHGSLGKGMVASQQQQQQQQPQQQQQQGVAVTAAAHNYSVPLNGILTALLSQDPQHLPSTVGSQQDGTDLLPQWPSNQQPGMAHEPITAGQQCFFEPVQAQSFQVDQPLCATSASITPSPASVLSFGTSGVSQSSQALSQFLEADDAGRNRGGSFQETSRLGQGTEVSEYFGSRGAMAPADPFGVCSVEQNGCSAPLGLQSNSGVHIPQTLHSNQPLGQPVLWNSVGHLQQNSPEFALAVQLAAQQQQQQLSVPQIGLQAQQQSIQSLDQTSGMVCQLAPSHWGNVNTALNGLGAVEDAFPLQGTEVNIAPIKANDSNAVQQDALLRRLTEIAYVQLLQQQQQQAKPSQLPACSSLTDPVLPNSQSFSAPPQPPAVVMCNNRTGSSHVEQAPFSPTVMKNNVSRVSSSSSSGSAVGAQEAESSHIHTLQQQQQFNGANGSVMPNGNVSGNGNVVVSLEAEKLTAIANALQALTQQCQQILMPRLDSGNGNSNGIVNRMGGEGAGLGTSNQW